MEAAGLFAEMLATVLHWTRTAIALAAIVACEAPVATDGAFLAFADTAVIREAYLTDRDERADIDSPAIWRRPGGGAWLFVTAKARDLVLVHDAATGALVARLGGSGGAAGRLDRPNGVAVVEDLLLVVERDNRRVQVFSLPELRPLGSFGEGVLRRPYGIATVERPTGVFELFVTDQDERADEEPALLAERVKRFRLEREGSTARVTALGAFGETTGPGVLHKVESIHADPVHDRLLIADEKARNIKVYTLTGSFTGVTIDGLFREEPEGIALYACGSDGYWIATDQSERANTFHVLDRESLEPVGAFRGAVTQNTDGVALMQGGLGPFRQGIFFAVHDDGSVSAFSWSDISRTLSLRGDCP